MYTLSKTKWQSKKKRFKFFIEGRERYGGWAEAWQWTVPRSWTYNGKRMVSNWCTTSWWYHENGGWCWTKLTTCGTAERHWQVGQVSRCCSIQVCKSNVLAVYTRFSSFSRGPQNWRSVAAGHCHPVGNWLAKEISLPLLFIVCPPFPL